MYLHVWHFITNPLLIFNSVQSMPEAIVCVSQVGAGPQRRRPSSSSTAQKQGAGLKVEHSGQDADWHPYWTQMLVMMIFCLFVLFWNHWRHLTRVIYFEVYLPDYMDVAVTGYVGYPVTLSQKQWFCLFVCSSFFFFFIL